jgi:hypothetical protein
VSALIEPIAQPSDLAITLLPLMFFAADLAGIAALGFAAERSTSKYA